MYLAVIIYLAVHTLNPQVHCVWTCPKDDLGSAEIVDTTAGSPDTDHSSSHRRALHPHSPRPPHRPIPRSHPAAGVRRRAHHHPERTSRRGRDQQRPLAAARLPTEACGRRRRLPEGRESRVTRPGERGPPTEGRQGHRNCWTRLLRSHPVPL